MNEARQEEGAANDNRLIRRRCDACVCAGCEALDQRAETVADGDGLVCGAGLLSEIVGEDGGPRSVNGER